MSIASVASLGWEDLEEWAGSAVVERGENYRRRVHDLAVTQDEHLVANVLGGESYLTLVWIAGDTPDHQCSCPYAGPCKHAVAVILTYLDHIRSGKSVPRIEADELDARSSAYGLAGGPEQALDVEKARAALKAMSKAKLVEWAMDRFADDPSLFDTLPLASPLTDKALAQTVARLRRRIRETASEGGWRDHWDHRGYTPDYAPIRAQLEKLLKGGHEAVVAELGEEIFERGTAQVEESDDEGETAWQIRECLAVVLNARGKTQQPAAKLMIWYWDKLTNDEYSLLEGLEPPVEEARLSRTDWREVAEAFGNRLASSPKPASDDRWSSEKYRRERLLACTQSALFNAGEDERAIRLMIEELPYCDNYVELVQCLLASKAYDQAAHWAHQGFHKTLDDQPGIAWKLVELLVEIARKRRDWLLVAALRAEAFVWHTHMDNYRDAEKAGRKADCWQQVRYALLRFLETGTAPSSTAGWPLPATGLQWSGSRFPRTFPEHNDLIAIALYESRTEDALQWFREAPNQNYHAEAVAKAVAETHPDVSLEVWRRKAENLIARVQPRAYREAVPYLSRMEKLLQSLGRGDEYRDYISALRLRHKAKRRLMEELDRLETRPRSGRR